MKTPRASVQEHVALVREIREDILCLADRAGHQTAYLRVFEIAGINYHLKSEQEQDQLLDLFQQVLASLRFPLQILWRSLPLHLDAYLAPYEQVLRQEHVQLSQSIPLFLPLLETQISFLRGLAARRTLLDRRIYLILRVDDTTPQRFLFSSKKRAMQQEERFEQARQELDVRTQELTRGFTRMGLLVSPLQGAEDLVPFYYSCLTPLKAQRYPLPLAVLEGIGRLTTSRPRTRRHRRSSPPQNEATSSLSPQSVHTSWDVPQMADLVAPSALVVEADHLRIEEQEEFVRALVVYQFPRVVTAGWLRPLAELNETMDISFHLIPRDSAEMIAVLQRRATGHRAALAAAQRQGRQGDPTIKVAESDLDHMITRLASGEEGLLEVTFFIVARGKSRQELDERTERIRSVLRQMLVIDRVAHYEQIEVFRSCLPHGKPEVRDGVLLDSTSLATMWHFFAHTSFETDGILFGMTLQGDPVVFHPWTTLPNANMLVLGSPGSGKSYAIKAITTRLMLASLAASKTPPENGSLPFQAIFIDPEQEYGRMTRAFGGQTIRLSPGSPHHLNPFDLPVAGVLDASTTREARGDLLADHVQKIHTLLDVMLADRSPDSTGTLTSQEKGLLDRALFEAYRRVGITNDEKTHDRPAPLMRDVYDVLESGVCGPDESGVLSRLHRYVHGSLAGLFAAPTNVVLDQMVVHFDVHDLESELRPIGLFLVTQFVWTISFQSRIPRQLVVDEAATLCQYESGARFLEDLVRRARKHYLGVTVITQHPAIFEGRSIPGNCAVQMLLRQDATALGLMEHMFRLSPRESQVVRRLGQGETLLLVGEKRMPMRFVLNSLEHLLATTDPRELASWRDAEQNGTQPHPFFSLLFENEEQEVVRRKIQENAV